jgi:prepilin-type N-terminal cleavage/methylation domain-containing protein
MNTNLKKSGFTLIELLVVISIIGLLSALSISTVKIALDKSKKIKTTAQIKEFAKISEILKQETGMALRYITGSAGSTSGCGATDMRNIPDTDSCYTKWITALTAMETKSNGLALGLASNIKRDAWGSPFYLDENEGELYSGTYCRKDVIRSYGPDGITSTDDITYSMPVTHESRYCQ